MDKQEEKENQDALIPHQKEKGIQETTSASVPLQEENEQEPVVSEKNVEEDKPLKQEEIEQEDNKEVGQEDNNELEQEDNKATEQEDHKEEEQQVLPENRRRKHIDAGNSDDENGDYPDSTTKNALQHKISDEINISNVTLLDEKETKRKELEDRMARALKSKSGGFRRRRRDEENLEEYLDEKILRLKDEMNIAAQKDIETIDERMNMQSNMSNNDDKTIKPAMEKIRLLPKVESVLSKVKLADTILDNNLLQSIRIWLEPLPDGSLPSFEIQKILFNAIDQLPIKTEHLKESGLGKVIIFYTKSSRVEPKLKRKAEKLVAEWTRPIIGASDNYRDKRILKMDFDMEKFKRKSATTLKQKLNKPNGNKKQKTNEDVEKAETLYEQAAKRKGRAAIPAQSTADYKYAPVSNIDSASTSHHHNIRSSGVGSSLNNNELYKRINNKLSKKKRS
ncbi:related to Transcription factor IWS1 [Saccharomycodes ludwigii]|uniref:Related to Transcription factor IWS1 n=1 Tax=Saccharomycodes ludwigii TaxID=36035 RepID=A0A376B4G6_9ASCO|nr:hypothetical protein SCDLUD_005212 [Saccharomycodes ludwigii]KAH3898873.1 hypothetical protein SCDLUD_005212 [Saccharomycodes ludwigii]SSD59597.1 related to Transcription factor IWS1 [Saccharomycodes ludwigii]